MTSICSVLFDAATDCPDKSLFVFPETRWNSADRLTYQDLATRSSAAANVISRLAQPEDRALLLFPTGAAFWEAFFGSLASRVIAVPLKIPNLHRLNEHLEQVCRDCKPSLLLTDQQTAELLRNVAENHPGLSQLEVVTPDQWRRERASAPVLPTNIQQTAFLQYTSGSTSQPKGVQVSHANLLTNMTMIRDRMGIRTGEDSTVTWLPHFHDMGLVGSYLTTLFTRNSCTCFPPEEFALRPATWLRTISTEQSSICGGPDFAFRLCVDKISEDEMDGVDLSSWRVAYVGAERIRSETIQQFAERFSAWGFRRNSFFPCYGLGEATLMATGGPAGSEPVLRSVSSQALRGNRVVRAEDFRDEQILVGSGHTFEGSLVLIVDPHTGVPLPDESIGEIHLSGDSITSGYFRKKELNQGLYCDLMVEGTSRRFLRTGDLGFLSGGQLFVTGRIKELIILRGRNLYPEDVESIVDDAHEALQSRGCVAFSVEQNGEESLIIAIELRRSAVKNPPRESITSAVRSKVAHGFGVNPHDILLLRPSSIPRTSSGKPRRLAVRESYLNGTLATLNEAPNSSGSGADTLSGGPIL